MKHDHKEELHVAFLEENNNYERLGPIAKSLKAAAPLLSPSQKQSI